MLDAIEKVRKLLSGNKEADLTCESLLDDIDFNTSISRDEFEKMIFAFTQNFSKCLAQALARSGLKQRDLDFVELVGEATRIPVCLEAIKTVFGVSVLSRTLNSQDCIARGCALQAAMLSRNSRVQDFSIEEFNEIPLGVTYQFSGSDKRVTKELFARGGTFPATQKLAFKDKLGGCQLLIHYMTNTMILPGLPQNIAQYEIASVKAKDASHSNVFNMFVSNDVHNICVLDRAIVQHVPEKSMFRNTGETTETVLNSKHSSFALAPAVRKQYIEGEKLLWAGDIGILRIK